MSLKKCNECKKEYSEQVKKCPHCGYKEKRKINKKLLLIIISIILCVTVIAILGVFVLKGNVKNKIYEGSNTTVLVEKSNLSSEEIKLYEKAILRNNESLLKDKSVKNIIAEEKVRQADEKKALEEKRLKEEEDKKILANAVTLNIYNKTIIYEDIYNHRFSDFIQFSMNCKNNSAKDIIALQGVIKISDLFGNLISNISLIYDTKTIPANGELDINDIGIDVNRFKDSHIKLRDTEFSKLKFEFTVNSVAFSDGTTLGK
ncbi:MAG: hypothetical protein RR662_07570 [Clostridia bacterium]